MAALAAGALVIVEGSQSPAPSSSPAATTRNTVPVSRRTLVKRSSESGTLGYSGKRAAFGQLAGTITWLPRAGTVVRLGERLYSVDSLPIVLMYGAEPAYRSLRDGVADGDDVLQLESNLAALGFTDYGQMTADREFTAATTAAVKQWQRSNGLRATGVVDLGRVLFLPGPRRVAEVKAALGSSGGGAGGPTDLMDTTSTRRVVTVQLDATKQTLARVGAKVLIELPDGRSTTGRVTSVAKVAVASRGGATIAVSIRLSGRRRVTTLDQAPVAVDFAESIRRHVLAVPVTALVATAGGGYAVQVPTVGGKSRLLSVTPGLYANGYVEIAGRGIHRGMRVMSA